MTRRAAALLLASLLLLQACSGTSPEDSKDSDYPAPGPVSAQAELNYGGAPTEGGGITYQPNVVLVGGGADMVRSVSGDSMTWTIDAGAPHIEDLEPGKVMFLTGRAVGRVLQLEQRDDDVVVTLGPVDLTEVIQDGDISVSTPLDVSAMTFRAFPEVVGVDGVAASVQPAVWTGGAPVEDPTLPPPTDAKSIKLSLGGLSAQLERKESGSKSELLLKLAYKKERGTVGLQLKAKFEAPTVQASLSFSGGTLTRNELRVEGLKEVAVGVDSGSELGLSGNFKTRLELPLEATFPIPAGGVPLVGSVRFKFSIETAFSARNATLAARGKLAVDGPIGFSGTDILVPRVEQTESPVENLTGVSVGVNGIVVALQLKVVVGLGVPAAFAGPFAAFTVSYGLTKGSAIGITTPCNQSSIDVLIGGGAGYTMSSKQLALLTFLSKKLAFPVKVDSELVSHTKSVVHEVGYLPKSSICEIKAS